MARRPRKPPRSALFPARSRRRLLCVQFILVRPSVSYVVILCCALGYILGPWDAKLCAEIDSAPSRSHFSRIDAARSRTVSLKRPGPRGERKSAPGQPCHPYSVMRPGLAWAAVAAAAATEERCRFTIPVEVDSNRTVKYVVYEDGLDAMNVAVEFCASIGAANDVCHNAVASAVACA